MTGPVFVNDPFPKTTSVVKYYHILPYKEILQGLLHREWTVISQHGLNSVIDEKLEEQGENSMSNMKKQTAKVSTPEQNKRAIKATGANSNQNSIINKQKKSCKRKAEASRATAAEGPDGESPITENESLIVPDVKTSGFVTKSINTKATTVVSGGPVFLQSGAQVDKNKTQNDNMHQDLSPPMLHKECILQERSIQCDMDIQTILNEGKMTPKVLSIGDKYKGTCSNMMDAANSSGSGDGGLTMSTKRKTLKEALHIRNKCQELDEICNLCEWILPRYTIHPSVADGMFCASVHLACPDFDMSIAGDPSPTPREARCSAAVNMMVELHKKAKHDT